MWSKVGLESELVGNGPFAASADGHDLVLVRGANGLRAFEGRCPHQGALLGEGEQAGERRLRDDSEVDVLRGVLDGPVELVEQRGA